MDVGITLTLVGIIIGLGAYFVVNRKSKNIVKGNKVQGDMVFGDKTTTVSLNKEKDE